MDISHIDTENQFLPYDPNLLVDLSKEQVKAAYLYQLLKYTAMDVKIQLENQFGLDNDELQIFDDDKLQNLANVFLMIKDPSVNDNTTWYNLLRVELMYVLMDPQQMEQMNDIDKRKLEHIEQALNRV